MAKANLQTLNDLHDAIANKYITLLQAEDVAPAVLSAVNKFLKDNDITATEVDSNPMGNLVDQFMANNPELTK